MIDCAVGESAAEAAIVAIEHPEAAFEIQATLDIGEVIGRLTLPGSKAFIFGDQITPLEAVGIGEGFVERDRNGAVQPAVAPHLCSDPGGAVAKHDASERAKRTPLRIEGRHASDQVEQEVLAEVFQLGAGKPELAHQPAGGDVRLMKKDLKVVSGNRRMHRHGLGSSLLMTSNLPKPPIR